MANNQPMSLPNSSIAQQQPQQLPVPNAAPTGFIPPPHSFQPPQHTFGITPQNPMNVPPNIASIPSIPSLPPPPDMQLLINKTAQKTVHSQNAFEFEELIRRKQSSNPQFSFLFRGHPWNHYYEWKKVTLKQQIQIQKQKQKQKSENNNNNNNNENNQNKDNKILTSTEIEEFNQILSELNGSNHSINNSSKWIMNHKNCANQVCNHLKTYFINNLMNKMNDFDKKLYILFMLNDVLHQTVKERILIDNIDYLSQQISEILLYIIPNSYNGYNNEKQLKIISLLNLWKERNIFNIKIINNLKNSINILSYSTLQPPVHLINNIGYPVAVPVPVAVPPSWPPVPVPVPVPSHHPPVFNINQSHSNNTFIAHNRMTSIPTNSLHVSIGKIKDLALELRRTGGGGTYVPLPIDKIPTINDIKNINDNNKRMDSIKDKQIKKAMDEYLKELCLIDPTRKSFSSSSKSSNRRSRNNRNKRRRNDDSRSRSLSRSRSRSFSRSRSRSSSRSS